MFVHGVSSQRQETQNNTSPGAALRLLVGTVWIGQIIRFVVHSLLKYPDHPLSKSLIL